MVLNNDSKNSIEVKFCSTCGMTATHMIEERERFFNDKREKIKVSTCEICNSIMIEILDKSNFN